MSEMIEVAVSELEGPALDWAVAEIESIAVAIAAPHYGTAWRIYRPGFGGKYSPSTDWAVGGPLIEKHIDGFDSFAGRTEWEAYCFGSKAPLMMVHSGPAETPLIAACRAIVAANLGETVMVPKELAP